MINEAYTELVNARAEKDDDAGPVEEVGQAVSITGAVVPFEQVVPVAFEPAPEPVAAALVGPPTGGVAAPPEGATVYTWGDRSCWFVGEHTAADVEAAFKAQS